MTKLSKPRFGELLVQRHLITAENLDQAIQKQKAEGGTLSRLLIEMGYISENDLLSVLSQQLNMPVIDLKNYTLKPDLIRKLPEFLSRRYQVILLEENSTDYLVGIVDPQDIIAIDELNHYLQKPIKLGIVREKEWSFFLDSVYSHTEQISTYAKELSAEITTDKDKKNLDDANLQEAYNAPVTKMLQSLFHDAIQMRASDIHIEPDAEFLRIRRRIDGVLHETIIHETGITPALALRLKLMAGLKIAEKRLPQDGRFSINIHHHTVDIRISTMPVQYGESIVMRLLDQDNIHLKMDQLGIPESVLNTLYRLIQLPHGMILVTGPTGSGKTSTLYSMLNELNLPENKIITVEDPVEYRLPRINQVQIHPQIGLTFAHILRAALRQDPDILMVGEIRDKETANVALNAAMTGHFVLATMHTNDAISSAVRLLEMESENYIVASGLRAVIAQRLLRKICDNCSENYTPNRQETIWLRKYLVNNDTTVQLKKGKGCLQCYQTGYKGRIPTFELFEIDDDIANAIIHHDLTAFSCIIHQKGFVTLAENAIQLAMSGVTTMQEVIRNTVDSKNARL